MSVADKPFQIELFFDFLSPYSYLGWTLFHRRSGEFSHLCEIKYRPVILSQVIHAFETKGPAEIPSKRDYLMKDCLRVARREKIPFVIPKQLPFNSLQALRWSLESFWGERQESFITACFEYCWQHGEDLGDLDCLNDYLLQQGFDTDQRESEVCAKSLRKSLKLNTKEAFSKNVFGLPTFLVSQGEESARELFWGADSIDHLMKYLLGQDDYDEEVYQSYLTKFSS